MDKEAGDVSSFKLGIVIGVSPKVAVRRNAKVKSGVLLLLLNGTAGMFVNFLRGATLYNHDTVSASDTVLYEGMCVEGALGARTYSRTVQTVDCWRLGSSSNSPNDVGAGGCGSRTV
jgi:hypothetical protein